MEKIHWMQVQCILKLTEWWKGLQKDVGVEVKSLIGKEGLIKKIEAKKYASETIGELTVKGIYLNELRKPGLDPREPRTRSL